MKITSKFLAFMMACGVAHASSVTWEAFGNTTIATSGGTLLGSGFTASVGWLDTATYDETNYADVNANFFTLGVGTFPYASNASYNGYFTANVDYGINDTLAGENIFVFITDGSSEWALLEFSGDTYKLNSAIPNTATYSINSTTVLSTTFHAGSYNAGAGTVNLTAIPEPSAALLGGLGSLMLLRRRRTKA